MAGRLLGLAEALWAQIDAGIGNEAMVTGRSIHEAARVLPAFRDRDEEELLHIWIQDDGKYRYIKPKAARDAQARFEQKLGEAMEQQGLPRLRESREHLEDMYDRLSRSVHNRRSACTDNVFKPAREIYYGWHPSPIRRGSHVEWGAAMTVEVTLAVGEGLETFYGRGFALNEVKPLIDAIEAARGAAPLDETSIRRAAGTL
jgi:hypothetical protein